MHKLLSRSSSWCVLGSLLLAGPALSSAAVPPLASGEAVPVGSPDRCGPLSTGLSNHPLGAANVYGGKRPDLFVAATTHSEKPGMYLFRYLRDADTGAPVFGEPVQVQHPFGQGVPPAGALLETPGKPLRAVWLKSGKLTFSSFDPQKRAFVADGPAVAVQGLPRSPERVAMLALPDGSVAVLLAVDDGVPQRPTEPKSWRDPKWDGFDGAGVWRGGWPYVCLYVATVPAGQPVKELQARRVTPTEKEALIAYGNVASVKLGAGHGSSVLTGSWFGNLLYYQNTGSAQLDLQKRQLAVGEDGIALRHPTIRPSPVSYPNPSTGMTDLVVGGEGHLYYYRATGKFNDRGAPVFASPTSVLEQDARLYPGSLSVLNVVDWDGDGNTDIVGGNSTGMVLFYRNAGSNAEPAFLPGVPIEADGHPIHVQPGYWDIQGPQEARWGYSCPTVFDWNSDGLPDLLLSDATARHTVFINRGTKQKPALDVGRPLYCDGLEVHGTWRVQPGVNRLGDKIAYVALDDQDEFHLYHRIDDYNVEDVGKLKLDDGSNIRANFLAAGGTGRTKIVLTDWDGDGKKDLLCGTPRHGSIPNPTKGLPQSKGLKGAGVVFLKNVGTDDAPVFAFPTLVKFRGQPIYLGQHACSPAPADFGRSGGPDLMVGNQDGRIMFYKRADLSWGPDAE